MNGLFIVLEGVEGCGKSTIQKLLADALRAHGLPVRVTREPGGTDAGERIRREVLHGADLPPEAELLLMLAARADHVTKVIVPALEAGEVVLCDRYELSSFAYQGIARGLGLERVRALNALATGQLRADLTIVLEVPASVAEARTGRRTSRDRIESAGAEFHARVAEAYRLLASEEPGVVSVDATRSPEQIRASILELLARRFPETFPTTAG